MPENQSIRTILISAISLAVGAAIGYSVQHVLELRADAERERMEQRLTAYVDWLKADQNLGLGELSTIQINEIEARFRVIVFGSDPVVGSLALSHRAIAQTKYSAEQREDFIRNENPEHAVAREKRSEVILNMRKDYWGATAITAKDITSVTCPSPEPCNGLNAPSHLFDVNSLTLRSED